MRSDPLVIEDLPGPENGQRTLRLKGPLVMTTLFEFQSKVRTDKSRNLILDLTGVPYVDSAGIGALVGAYVTHHRKGLFLVGVSDRVRAAFETTHVDQFFRFFNSLKEIQSVMPNFVVQR
jgi:anti-sigma B factor antagonist